MRKLLTLTSLALLAATAANAQVRTNSMVQPGTMAPDFKLKEANGTEHRLAEHQGKYIVIEWARPDCPFVKKHYESGNMKKTQDMLASMDGVWLTIYSVKPDDADYVAPDQVTEQFKNWGSTTNAVLFDADAYVAKQYGASNTPQFFVISPTGKVIYAGALDDKPTTDPADIDRARNYVFNALTEAKSGKPISEPVTKPYGCEIKT
ncbi:MAG: redoxin domain-containing protein [Armatimonadetes bacterium]|nr:redoxin domain-containing protein [Armatimonadota bacterium]